VCITEKANVMTSKSPSAPERDNVSPSHLDFPVVGIGASAGGLQAIKLFFEHMPQDTGMAFVIILHLSPDHQSIADKIIQNRRECQCCRSRSQCRSKKTVSM
jgi:two-component system CheB/CheR fusion protein